MTWPEPIRLQGSRATLTPLTHSHANDLVEAVHDGELWNLWYTSIPAPDKMVNFIDQRLAAQADGSCLPFAVIDNATGKAIGMTNYLNVEPDHRRLEIGGTWYRKSVQRSHVNTQCKLLLLSRVSNALFQLSEPSRYRETGRKTGRCTAQPSDSQQRNASRHLRL
jgi:RimJ/RimL family protein N-acetyltransferase